MHVSFSFIFVVLVYHTHPSIAQDKYDGHYDLKARDAAYLCVLMEDYLKTGKQPSLTKITPGSLTKEKYLNGKPCWKFAWVPCDAATYQHTTQRPCGWYEMQKAPDGECS